MSACAYLAVDSLADARRALLEDPRAELIAGGTTVVDLMHSGLTAPSRLIDISRLPLAAIETDGPHVRIGALARNSDVARHPEIARAFPALAQALLAGASGQLRNMATVGGNLLQRTRCPYFREPSARCNKREPQSGCDAREGLQRTQAIFGTSDACSATHASDMTAALAVFDAQVVVARGDDEGRLSFDQFYLVPGETPQRETTLRRGDVIVAVELQREPLYAHSSYLKLRDRASYEFALVSVAACLQLDRDRTIRDVRVALGGVATIPWRARAAERILAGATADVELFARAAEAELAQARPRADNAFKLELTKRALCRVFADLAETHPA